MMYFKDTVTGGIYGYDEKEQKSHADKAIAAGWIDVTAEIMSRPVIPEPTLEQREARAYLNKTDWYVTRSIETGKPVPPEVLEKRQAARLVLN